MEEKTDPRFRQAQFGHMDSVDGSCSVGGLEFDEQRFFYYVKMGRDMQFGTFVQLYVLGRNHGIGHLRN